MSSGVLHARPAHLVDDDLAVLHALVVADGGLARKVDGSRLGHGVERSRTLEVRPVA
jgi:hypothetical protein